MKKILSIVFPFIFIILLTACGKQTVLENFNTEATIEETVLVDENNVKITAKELTYNASSAEIHLYIENNSDKNLIFKSNSLRNRCNSVNGYMINDGDLNCEVAAKSTADDKIKIDFDSLRIYGITCIADIEIGFVIGDDFNSINIEPRQIKTSLAKSYDYSENNFQKVIKNGAFANTFGGTIMYCSDNELYNQNDVCIPFVSLFKNKYGELVLFMEVENNSKEIVNTSIKEVYFNDCLVCDSVFLSKNINANKRSVQDVLLKLLIEKYEGDTSELQEISKISFTFNVGENSYDTFDSKKISIDFSSAELQNEKTQGPD